MGLYMYRVRKDRIQTALKEMNRKHDHFEAEVKNVVEKDTNYEVFVNHDNSYPFVTNNWEENKFYGVDKQRTEPDAWLHIMDNTEDIEDNVATKVLMFNRSNPFGIPGKDYSKEFKVTKYPLYL